MKPQNSFMNPILPILPILLTQPEVHNPQRRLG